jgi:probable F420-dependent oxidoreductase
MWRDTMRFGLFAINMGVCSQPEVAIKAAQVAEAAGFESVWTGEHVVLPDPRVPPSPLPPDHPLLDPAIALAFIAGHTRTIRLGTGIIILPQRNPLVLAKELASLDVVSGGRLIFGLGIGYLRPEFDALGISFEDKGPRAIEYLQAMLALWTQPAPTYDGRFVAFRNIQAHPRPVQQPHPPIIIGGHSPAAFRRAVRYGNGWYGYALDLDATTRCVTGLREALARHERPAALGEIDITITPNPRLPLTLDMVRRYADLGVQRLVLFRPTKTAEELLLFIQHSAEELLGKVSTVNSQ